MLQPVKRRSRPAAGRKFAIVASRYNAHYVDAMIRAARSELTRAGAEKIEVIRVPGAYEIPLAAQLLAGLGSIKGYHAIICMGVILRGETAHADHIGRAVSEGLMSIQLRNEVPVVHEVLLLENKEQARVRCLDPKFNRGHEAAQTAIEMANLVSKPPLATED